MKRYCDYDAIVHDQPGEFASRFSDDLMGDVEVVERGAFLAEWIIRDAEDWNH